MIAFSKTLILITTIVLMLNLVAAGRAWACYAIIVGREASVDGAVLVAHNEQNGGRRILNFRRIPPQRYEPGSEAVLRRGGRLPQVAETLGFLWSENPGLEFSDGYLNEYGVAVVSDGCRTREDDYETLVRRGEIRGGGIGYMLRRLVIQRARTAREGVKLAGKLVDRFGYVDSGRTYVVADPREAWLLSVVRGQRWVAQRVPDNMIVALPNIHVIGEVDLNDTENFLASDDLISYAVTRGWYDPERGEPFSFRKVYRKDRRDRPDPRRWRGRQLAAGSDEPWPPKAPPALGIRPKKKLSVEALVEILRFTGSPGTLCTPSTQEGAVFQLRSDIPPAIGCVYWRTTAEPSTSALTPWYVGIEHTPKSYYRPAEIHKHLSLDYHFEPPAGAFKFDPDSAWWTFRRLQKVVREDHSKRIRFVQPVWAAFEREALADQARVEAEVVKLWNSDRQTAVDLLTTHCARLAAEASRQAAQLTERLVDLNSSLWSYGCNAEEPPLDRVSQIVAAGDPDAAFGGFGHAGTDVKARNWSPFRGRQGESQVLALRMEPGEGNHAHLCVGSADVERAGFFKPWPTRKALFQFAKELPKQKKGIDHGDQY